MLLAFANLLIPIAFIVSIVLLQIFLSKKENKWLGLILPIISLLIAIIAVFNVASFTTITTTGVKEIIDSSGTVIQEITPEVITQGEQSTASLIFTIASVFILYNIPTAVFLAIYLASRENSSTKRKPSKRGKLMS